MIREEGFVTVADPEMYFKISKPIVSKYFETARQDFDVPYIYRYRVVRHIVLISNLIRCTNKISCRSHSIATTTIGAVVRLIP